jgi:hypothetical protein
MKILLSIPLFVAFAPIVVVKSFSPQRQTSIPLRQPRNLSKFNKYPKQTTEHNSNPSTSTRSTELHWGVLVPVPDDFFTITGISLGFAYTILRSWNRVTVENVAWENRLEDARLAKLDDDDVMNVNAYTELDLRKADAAASKSAYGPGTDSMDGREAKRRSRRVQTLDEEYYDDEDEESNRNYSMTDEQINEFEETYGVEYDPYYDEPYTVDELPDDVSFVEDKVYGDRRYEDGEIFYRDERNDNLYWRQGGRPRLKQFWELL